MQFRPVYQRWNTGVGDVQAASTTAAPGGQFWTAGPGLGERKFFTEAEEVESIAESTDGRWRLLLYADEILWMHRNNLRPIAGSRLPVSGYGSYLGDGADPELLRKLAEKDAALDRILELRLPPLEAAVAQVRASTKHTRDI